MSRRSTAKSSQYNRANSSTLSSADDLLPENRRFLIRSLKRNDLELSALIDLHRSLHAVKNLILKQCGDNTLLDLGQGRLELAANDSLIIAAAAAADKHELPPAEAQPLCVDFLLRMKLRRKLLNRLARRLHRVAHAMDGNDVQSPAPPKYGDLRLHVDPAAVMAFAEHWKRQDEAIRKIEAAREEYAIVKEDEETKDEAKAEEEQQATTMKGEEEPQATTMKGEEEQQATNVVNKVENSTVKTKPDDEVPSTKKEETVVEKEEDDETAKKVETEDEKTQEESKEPMNAPKSAAEEEDPLEACYDVLCDYKDVYEKLIDPATGAVKYTIVDHPHQEDYEQVKFGVGSIHGNMTTKEKETEFKRWRAALLSCIPDQPTFEELGMKNRVFFLEERRKRALENEKEEEDPPAKKAKEQDDDSSTSSHASKKKIEEDSDDSSNSSKSSNGSKDPMDVEEEEKAASEAVDADETSEGSKDKKVEGDPDDDEDASSGEEDVDMKGEGDVDDKKKQSEDAYEKDPESDAAKEEAGSDEESPSKTTKGEKKEKPEEEEKKEKSQDEKEAAPVRVKPISLIPVPSFYEQDLKRIRLIQFDLLMTSMQDELRHRLEEGTREYNAGKSRN
jgi:hypothetical protein